MESKELLLEKKKELIFPLVKLWAVLNIFSYQENKLKISVLSSVAQLVEHCPTHQKAEGLISGQGSYLDFGFDVSHITVSLSPPLPFSLKSINIFF